MSGAPRAANTRIGTLEATVEERDARIAERDARIVVLEAQLLAQQQGQPQQVASPNAVPGAAAAEPLPTLPGITPPALPVAAQTTTNWLWECRRANCMARRVS